MFFFSMCTCVPGVVTAGPRQDIMEGGEKVEEGPGQYDNIIHHSVKHQQQAAKAYTWRKTSTIPQMLRQHELFF